MADTQPLPSLSEWQILEFQLISFPTSPQAAVEQAWWNDLTGGDCTSTRKRLERVDNGPFDGRDFTLQIDPLRVVWKADFLPVAADAQSPLIGNFEETRDWFSDLMLRWLAIAPPINRLAFIAKAIVPTDSREASYGMLSQYLPCIKVDQSSREFLYRINRPRQSHVIPELHVNRLATWVPTKIAFQAHMAGTAPQIINQILLQGCQVQLDINTSEENTTPIPADKLPVLWNELVAIGAEITEHGDVA